MLPIRAARKADAIGVIIRLDRRTFARPADPDPSIAMQLVLAEPPSTAVVLMQEVETQKKRVAKAWARFGSSQIEVATDDRSFEAADCKPRL